MSIINLERKKEYTYYLQNILAPILYDGILSIYKDGTKLAEKNTELKIFQSLLKNIPDWSNTIIENEVNRIITVSKCDFLHDLVKAVIKSNVIILMNNENISDSLYVTNLNNFIHNCYITIAKEFYQYPELFNYNCNSVEIKRNQREAIKIIKDCIENTIRKMLPLNLILNNYISDKELINDPNTEKQNVVNMLSNEQIKQFGGKVNDKTDSIYNNSVKNSHTSSSNNYSNSTQTMTRNSSKPKLVSEKALESALSESKKSSNTNSIIENLKKNKILSSENEEDDVKSFYLNKNKTSKKIIEKEIKNNSNTSISYNLENDNYVSVFNNNNND